MDNHYTIRDAGIMEKYHIYFIDNGPAQTPFTVETGH